MIKSDVFDPTNIRGKPEILGKKLSTISGKTPKYLGKNAINKAKILGKTLIFKPIT